MVNQHSVKVEWCAKHWVTQLTTTRLSGWNYGCDVVKILRVEKSMVRGIGAVVGFVI